MTAVREWHDYEWILVCGSIVAFFMAWSIGANDVANAFATSVGSKSITIFQALMIATVCEFLGAMLLGGEVVKTIAGGIADINAFVEDPEFLAYGMLCALLAAAVWVTYATSQGLAVSTTHSTIGGIIGFALVYKGGNAVLWYQEAITVNNYTEYLSAKKRSNFVVGNDQVPIRGMVAIVLSWFTSPICCAFMAALHFFLVRTFVMRRKNALFLSYFGGKTGVCTKGDEGSAKGKKYSSSICTLDVTGSPTVKSGAAAWIAVAVAGGISLMVAVFVVPFIIRRANMMNADGVIIDADQKSGVEGRDLELKDVELKDAMGSDQSGKAPTQAVAVPWYRKAYDAATYGMFYDIHEAVQGDTAVQAVHSNAEKFDPRAEQSFRPVQVFTSACVSFAHGANDVANSVGPLAAIYQVYKTRTAGSSADMPTWILAIGATGIVIGLATYGYHIMRVLGTEMVLLTPCRGFSVELATAVVVSVGSMYGFPLSTTQCQTGSTVGVGLLEGGVKGVNWWLFGKQMLGWVFTLIVAGFLSAALFAQAVFAPSVIMSRDISRYEALSIEVSTTLINAMGSTIDVLRQDTNTTNTTLSAGVTGAAYTSSFEKTYLNDARSSVNTSKTTLYQKVTLKNGKSQLKHKGVLTSQFLTSFVRTAVYGYKNSSVLTFGSSFSQGTGWNKSAFQAQRGSDFAKLP